MPAGGLGRPVLAAAEWWARVPVSKRGIDLRHTRDGERRDDFDLRREWWTADALPEQR